MSINKKIIITAAVALSLGASSCRKFFNINKNPNQATTATVQTLLPAAELYVASTLGVDMQVNGGIWGEYWTQSPSAQQYQRIDKYNPLQDDFSTPWTNLYAAAENFRQLGILADSTKKKQYKAIALVMKAYTFQLITDAWGDVPYKQALKGMYADSNITSPKYDSQSTVYNGIIADIDSALVLIDPSDAVAPGTDDLIYGGNMAEWRKFAYTLKLRVYLRMSNIAPAVAQAGIVAMYGETNFSLIGDGDDAKIAFGYSAANKSPLYAEASSATLASTQNLVGSSTCIDSMNSNDDNRILIFYEPAAASGAYTGLAQGFYSTTSSASAFSIPSIYVAGDAQNSKSGNAPVNFITSYESYFLQAEVAARGWAGSAGDDAALFYKGIHANFNYYSSAFTDLAFDYADTTGGFVLPSGNELSQSVTLTAEQAYYLYTFGDTFYVTDPTTPAPSYWASYPATGSVTQKLRHIITQKWFSMCGNQSFEAWSEKRRTGYPDFFVLSVNAVAPQYPKRFLYPTSESTRNANFPGLIPVTTKVWWDLF